MLCKGQAFGFCDNLHLAGSIISKNLDKTTSHYCAIAKFCIYTINI
jgi:hypothetical protein